MKLIVDADLLLHRSCAAVEKEITFDDLHHMIVSNFDDALGVLLETVNALQEAGNTEDIIFAISDPDNWRKRVLPSYKGNRKGMRKPLCFARLKDYVQDHYPYLMFRGLEADDIMGMYCSRDGYAIWTLDKDLKQCPGIHLIDDEYVEINEADGDWMHWFQTLNGDLTDGYTGCPGVGKKSAEEFLADPFIYVREEREMKSGPNKGQVKEFWTKEPTDDIWAGIVSHYEKAGLTEDDALVQARVARMLRDGEYDFKNRKVKLWKPN